MRALAALATIFALSGCAQVHGETLQRSKAPLALTLPDLHGARVDLQALRGQVVLLDFWATWCEPCREGLPKTEALLRANAGRGLAVFAISVDEDPAVVPPFVTAQKLGLPVLLDPNGAAMQPLGGEQLPFVALLDRAGYVRYARAGAGPVNDHDLAAAVQALLVE